MDCFLGGVMNYRTIKIHSLKGGYLVFFQNGKCCFYKHILAYTFRCMYTIVFLQVNFKYFDGVNSPSCTRVEWKVWISVHSYTCDVLGFSLLSCHLLCEYWLWPMISSWFLQLKIAVMISFGGWLCWLGFPSLYGSCQRVASHQIKVPGKAVTLFTYQNVYGFEPSNDSASAKFEFRS